jgi:hypothetical protein
VSAHSSWVRGAEPRIFPRREASTSVFALPRIRSCTRSQASAGTTVACDCSVHISNRFGTRGRNSDSVAGRRASECVDYWYWWVVCSDTGPGARHSLGVSSWAVQHSDDVWPVAVGSDNWRCWCAIVRRWRSSGCSFGALADIDDWDGATLQVSDASGRPNGAGLRVRGYGEHQYGNRGGQ